MSERIRVAIDTRDLKKGNTGTYYYLQSLCDAFKKQEGEVEYHYIRYWLPVYKGSNKLGKVIEHLSFTLWKQLVLPIYCIIYSIDLLFCTDYFLPLAPIPAKKVVVFHDTFFYEQPEHYNSWWLKTFHWIAVRAAKKAQQVIVPTEYVKERLGKFLPTIQDRILVVYEGPKELVKQKDTAWENKITTWLSGSDYLLHVGTLDHRKNLIRLVAAYEIVLKKKSALSGNQSAIKLIIAGDSPKYFSSNGKIELTQAIKNKGLEKNILLTGTVSETQLSYLYQNARVYVFPSLNEGFGLPLVEAMKYQIPIAAANNTALPEVGGGAALYFDPTKEEEMAEQINTLLQNEAIRTTLQSEAKKRILLFNWDLAAAALKNIFIQVNKKKLE